jgi:multidrug efflux pump
VQNGIEYSMTIDNSVTDIESIKNIVVATGADGEYIYVRDVAKIEDGLAKYISLSRLSVDGSASQQAVTFSVFKQVGGDITELTKEAREGLDAFKESFPESEFVTLIDSGEDISGDIRSLSSSALQTIFLVIFILSIGLGVRESIIAGIAVPASFLLAFIGLYFTGGTLNFISLFALILSIGMLVDGAIVIVEGITMASQKGLDTNNAIRATLKEFAAPVIAGTMTTLVVFIPLATISGITGQFIRSIPLTIIFVLISSLIVALIFVPLMSTFEMKNNKQFKFLERLENWRESNISRVTNWYKKTLHALISSTKGGKRFIYGLITLFVLSLTLVGTGLIKSEFFPADQFTQLTINAELPKGSLLGDMDNTLKPAGDRDWETA